MFCVSTTWEPQGLIQVSLFAFRHSLTLGAFKNFVGHADYTNFFILLKG